MIQDKDHEEKLEMEEHVPVPQRVYIALEDLEEFVHVVAQGVGETCAHRELSTTD